MPNARLSTSRLLTHPVRALILRVLKARPGLTFSELLNLLRADLGRPGFGAGAFAWHVATLERAKLVVSMRSGRVRRHYLRQGPWMRDLEGYAFLQGEPFARIAQVIAGHPGLLLGEVHERLASGKQGEAATLRRDLRSLCRRRLVRAERRGRQNVYEATPRLLALLEAVSSFRTSAAPTSQLALTPHPTIDRPLGGQPRPALPPLGAVPVPSPTMASPVEADGGASA